MKRLPLLALALTACAPVAAFPTAEPFSAAPSVDTPLRLVGTEPFWGVLLKDGSLSLNGVDRGAIVAPIARTSRRGAATVFETAPSNVSFPVAVRVVVTPGPCSDGMSDRTYPHSAVVDIDYAGASAPVTLTGCAGPEELFSAAAALSPAR